jgi:hypothetical protein
VRRFTYAIAHVLTNFIKKISQSKTHYRGIEYRRNYCKTKQWSFDAAIAASIFVGEIK